jgi:hypothetical protein
MELTTIQPTVATPSNAPSSDARPSNAQSNTAGPNSARSNAATLPATPSVLIQGAQRACELEPTVRLQCVRNSHAPAAKATASPQQINWDDEEIAIPGAEVWQELVRMLVAREAAKLLHPAGRARV